MASSKDSSFKVAYNKDGVIGFYTILAKEKQPGYIPIGSAITSYARYYTITHAQQNYYGINKPGFIYADTDSIHCDLPENKLKGIKLHDTNFGAWKIETKWKQGLFVRKKTYIEMNDDEFIIKCAGMPDKCKKLFKASVSRETMQVESEAEKDFIKTKRTLTDFKRGLIIPGKLLPKRIKGGLVLKDTTYEMR